jgi:predicted transcriptional regulator
MYRMIDLEFIEVLKLLGKSRSVAVLVAYLMNVNEANSKKIELGTGLRQPDVSKGLRALRAYNWIEEQSDNNRCSMS